MNRRGKPKRILPDIEVGSKVISGEPQEKEERPSIVDLTLTLNPYPAKKKKSRDNVRVVQSDVVDGAVNVSAVRRPRR